MITSKRCLIRKIILSKVVFFSGIKYDVELIGFVLASRNNFSNTTQPHPINRFEKIAILLFVGNEFSRTFFYFENPSRRNASEQLKFSKRFSLFSPTVFFFRGIEPCAMLIRHFAPCCRFFFGPNSQGRNYSSISTFLHLFYFIFFNNLTSD